jgi:type 1 glutamine amidotransferase
MDQGVPEEAGRRASGNPKAAIERVVAQGQGIVVLHHALLAWEKWEFWNQLIGFENRNFRYKEGLDLNITVADQDHDITQRLANFTITDEGYVLHGEYDGKGKVLLSTEHPDAMKQVVWAREQEKSRVVCVTLGHDHLAWSNPEFQEVLRSSIEWASGD